MSPQAAFGISILLSLVAWGTAFALYFWPALRRLPQAEALRPLLLIHTFRFVGLAFIVPGVVSPDLPAAFARPDAYGDMTAALLALIALAGLRTRFGTLLVWVFNLWGSADLLNAFYQGNRIGLQPGDLGAAYFIVTFGVPLLLTTHVLIFRLLFRSSEMAAAGQHSRAA